MIQILREKLVNRTLYGTEQSHLSSKQSFFTRTNARNIRSNIEENVHKNSSNKGGERTW